MQKRVQIIIVIAVSLIGSLMISAFVEKTNDSRFVTYSVDPVEKTSGDVLEK